MMIKLADNASPARRTSCVTRLLHVKERIQAAIMMQGHACIVNFTPDKVGRSFPIGHHQAAVGVNSC